MNPSLRRILKQHYKDFFVSNQGGGGDAFYGQLIINKFGSTFINWRRNLHSDTPILVNFDYRPCRWSNFNFSDLYWPEGLKG